MFLCIKCSTFIDLASKKRGVINNICKRRGKSDVTPQLVEFGGTLGSLTMMAWKVLRDATKRLNIRSFKD
jgi:hypothetical protein